MHQHERLLTQSLRKDFPCGQRILSSSLATVVLRVLRPGYGLTMAKLVWYCKCRTLQPRIADVFPLVQTGHRINPLPSASGSIWSAITVDYPYHSFSHIGLYYGENSFTFPAQQAFLSDLFPSDGINGRLPNLDVVHGAAHITKWIGGVPVRLHNQSIVDVAARHSAASISSHYFQRGKGVLRQMLQSAATLPSGAEGLFSE